ncbi:MULTISPECIES: catalase-related domain-containing protein [unclassified Micromonospora]|uniref:catalase-related domain-containing protein n=1 Tax=unclassified Micromonospora TaxID=2617518 RepID=UPI002FEE6DFD
MEFAEFTYWGRCPDLAQCDKHIQERMVRHFSQCDEDYGRRVAEGLGISATH